jgi:N-acetylglucosaminyl-diphospho-decaprenol L-rhamnosyltransferase
VSARPPDVSVSVVNTSSRDLLLACLASLERDLDGPYSIEVVVLDNASEDGSAEAVRERYPWVRVIAQPFRAGFGANHNAVIRATEGRYVYVLNEDATVEPGSFDKLVRYMDANPRVAGLAPRIRYPDGREQASAWRFPTPGAAALGAVTLARAGIVQSHGDETKRVDWAMACALLLRRSALDEVGIFDEGFFIYSEETDLAKRFEAAGYETHYFPSVTAFHHVSQFSAKIPERRIAEEWRSRRRYWRKHHSRAGARIAGVLTGWQYAVRAVIASAGVRFGRFDPDAPARFRLHARNAWRGPQGPGLRELAADWNREHQVSPPG